MLGRQQSDQIHQPTPLLASPAVEVDRVVISDSAGKTTLEKRGGNWILPEMADLPADSPRLTAAIESIATASTTWPVTSTTASHERFEVARDKFQRRIRLYRGENNAADFYLGTSPGLRQVHLRRAGSDDVYKVELSAADLPASDEDWLDKGLLAVAGPEQIRGVDYTLRKNDSGSWTLEQESGATAGDGPALDQDKARQLASAISQLRVQGVAAKPASPPDTGEAEPADQVALVVDTADGQKTFRFRAVDSTYYVQRDDIDTLFTLGQYDYDRIAGLRLAGLHMETVTADVDTAVTTKDNIDDETDTAAANPAEPAEG